MESPRDRPRPGPRSPRRPVASRRLTWALITLAPTLAGCGRLQAPAVNEGVLAPLSQGDDAKLEVRDYPELTHSIQFDAPGKMTRDIDRWIDQRILTGGAHP